MDKSPNVKIEIFKGKYTRAKWTFEKQSYCLYLGKCDQTYDHIVDRIKTDIIEGKFDRTLKKYKSSYSLETLINQWLDWKKTYCDRRTWEFYRTPCRQFLKLGMNFPVTRKDAEIFFKHLKDSGISQNYMRRKLKALEEFFSWLILHNHENQNPFEGLSKLVKIPEKNIDPFSKDEIEKIISGFKNHQRYSQLYPFIYFLFKTGCRLGEAVGLRWQDIQDETITISQQLTRGKRKPVKNGKSRSFRLSPELINLINSLRNKSSKPDDLIFQWNGKSINLTNFQKRVWKSILTSENIRYRRPYNCRHSFITNCLKKGINPVHLAEITGHKIKTMFEFYAGFIKEIPNLPTF